MEYKNLVAVAVSICLFSALGMLFGASLAHHDRGILTIYTVLSLLPCAAALWLSRCTEHQFAGE